MNKVVAPETDRLVSVTLENPGVRQYRENLERERAAAIRDLERHNTFALDGRTGPYQLCLCCHDGRLVLDVRDTADAQVTAIRLPLQPFRRTIKDYITVCESYYSAVRSATLAKIEAIDMGRRGLHNEGAALLQERLAQDVAIDHDTARRLFTLVCVLHFRS